MSLYLVDAHTVLGRIGRNGYCAQFVGRFQDAFCVSSGSITVSSTRDQHADVGVQSHTARARRLESETE